MKKKILLGLCMSLVAAGLSGCGGSGASGQETQQEQTEESASESTTESENTDTETAESNGTESSETEGQGSDDVTTGDSNILVAYFTRLPNTESGDDLDAVVQGGGPYGEIGDSFESADMDSISSASITVMGDEVKGNVETIADWIAADTGGELFSIETVEKYPQNYDELIELGGQEQRDNYRPELSTHVDNMDQYSVIYLGYPNWYHDMPMAIYSFLEEYDLQGKTIVPFCTSAGNGMAGTVSSIQETVPEATVVNDGLAVYMYDVASSQPAVEQWLDSLDIE